MSHTLEEILKAMKIEFDHEKIGIKLITSNGDVGFSQVLNECSSELANEIASYVEGTTAHWTASIVSSQLDADRLDYVRRDAQLAGVHNVHPDIERLIANLCVRGNDSSAGNMMANLQEPALRARGDFRRHAEVHEG